MDRIYRILYQYCKTEDRCVTKAEYIHKVGAINYNAVRQYLQAPVV